MAVTIPVTSTTALLTKGELKPGPWISGMVRADVGVDRRKRRALNAVRWMGGRIFGAGDGYQEGGAGLFRYLSTEN